jgi:hypothetical protein
MNLALGCILVIARPVLAFIVVPQRVKAPGASGRWAGCTHQTLSREFVPARFGGPHQGRMWDIVGQDETRKPGWSLRRAPEIPRRVRVRPRPRGGRP